MLMKFSYVSLTYLSNSIDFDILSAMIKENKPPSLLICIALDIIGNLSFIIPGIGEFSDVLWAPISAILFLKIFGGRVGKIGAAINFVEEIFPFSDFIPTFTIAWIVKSYSNKKFGLINSGLNK